ncbi:hypothetical protein E4U42_001784 [Claviceps africana]|uniref:Glutamate--tRNA ligase, mitochondrial n=1 Tax=Claviceps africana TaxID=83212 RepID=A0A8K0NJY1_9HYPO|nr:hypothetical protein E4U42_001784 [Claviceps africana]
MLLLFLRTSSRPPRFSITTLLPSPGSPTASSRCCRHAARRIPTCSAPRSYFQSHVHALDGAAGKPPQSSKPNPAAGASGLNALRDRNKAVKQKTQANAYSQISPRTIFGQSVKVPIRARFAPSPTGYLHLGSLRTALFNRLAAEASKRGAFILRIEDTDQKRLVDDAEARLIQDLQWAGLTWDEGPDCGGPYGPYKQSLRLDIYQEHVQTLLDLGHAYRCFCSPEELESQKQDLHEAGKSTAYPGTCRSVDAAESDMRASRGDAHVVRLKGDTFGRPMFCDAIHGSFQKKEPEEDFVLLKSDGFPTYHLANVVDDHLMKITHVIRGEEWLISTPKHLALYQAFGWDPPTFAHLGLLVNPDGSKLSKRNDSVDLSTYRKKGIAPMALLSWLAHLGSSFKSDIKYHPLTISDLTKALTFRFTRGGIKLNVEKLNHFQTKYLDSLLWDTEPAALEKIEKDRIICDFITEPVIKEIKLLKKGKSPNMDLLPEEWRHDFTLVPIMSALDMRSQEYIFDIVTERGGYVSTETLLQQHPYLVWQVPETLHRRSLASYKPDERVMHALEEVLEKPDLWGNRRADGLPIMDATGRDDAQPVMDAIWAIVEGQDVEKLAVYDTLRLIGAGRHDVVSLSSTQMFTILGREEWRRRTDAVKRLLDAPVDG